MLSWDLSLSIESIAGRTPRSPVGPSRWSVLASPPNRCEFRGRWISEPETQHRVVAQLGGSPQFSQGLSGERSPPGAIAFAGRRQRDTSAQAVGASRLWAGLYEASYWPGGSTQTWPAASYSTT